MLSERVYRILLQAYPKEHRREYEESMVQLFRDRMRRDGGGLGTLVVWMHMLFDLVRSASRERMEIARRWAIRKNVLRALLLRDYTARTARTRKQVVVSLLLPVIYCLVFAAVAGTVSIFLPVSDRYGDTLFRSSVVMFGGMAIFNPVFHGLVFRLRAKYDLKNALRAIAIYLPICIFVATVLMHFMFALSDGETPLLTITWLEIMVASYFGVIMCILPVLMHRVGFASEPAPAIIAHHLYRRTEMAVSLGSLLGISILLLLAL